MAEREEELKSLLMKVKSESKVAQSYLTHKDPMDCSPPGSSIHGIFQARVMEWGAIAFSVMYSAYKLNKQGDNIQPWRTPFPILYQSVVPCLVLTVASWPAYRFLKRQDRWSEIPISLNHRGMECKSRKSGNTRSHRQIWRWSTEWSRAKANRVLQREHTSHRKYPFPTRQKKTLHMDITTWSILKSDWLYSLQPKMEKLYTVSKNKTGSWLWLRSWTPYCQIQTQIEESRENH